MINATHMNASLRSIDAADRYFAGETAWNDGSRGVTVVGGTPTLSAWGSNITDCRIVTEEGGTCQYIKPHNMDETLGVMHAKDILMVDKDGENLSVQDVLDDVESKCKYMGYRSIKVNADANQRVVVRFQTSWVPIKKDTHATKIVPQHYSYQTQSDSDPCNFLILGTPQGIFAHNDVPGPNNLFAHRTSETGRVTKHWFEAEANKDCLVGHAARDADDVPDGAPASKKARAVDMGIRGMGPRTNCFVTVAIPNAQTHPAHDEEEDDGDEVMVVYRSMGPVFRTARLFTGVSHAARVSVASESVGTCDAKAIDIVRLSDKPIVVTVLTYNTIEVPDDYEGDPTVLNVSTKDIALGVADLDRQYELVKKNGGVVCQLSELPAMLHKLEHSHMLEIAKTLKQAPPADAMTPTPMALSSFV